MRPSARRFAHDLAFDHDRRDVARVLEGIAVEERDVAVLTDRERPHPILDSEDLCGIPGDRRQGAIEAEQASAVRKFVRDGAIK